VRGASLLGTRPDSIEATSARGSLTPPFLETYGRALGEVGSPTPNNTHRYRIFSCSARVS
jgi:hypothetical protein